MTPDPPSIGIPFVAGGEGNPARDERRHHGPSRAGTSCWLCGHPIIDPPEIIGQWHATRARVAHRRCLQILGELDLDLPPSPA